MFYLASNPKGVFLFYFEEGRTPYSSTYGSIAFPTQPPTRATTYTFTELNVALSALGSTIIDADISYYALIDRHPEYLI